MPTYATADDLRADPAIPDNPLAPTDAELDNKLLEAEDLIDRIVGARDVVLATGRKLDPTLLQEGAVTTIRRCAVIVAAALYEDPDAFTPPAAQTISGPDFTLTNVAALPPKGAVVLLRVAALLDVYRLRVLHAYLPSRSASGPC